MFDWRENLAFLYKEAMTTSTMTKPCCGALEELCETTRTRNQACKPESQSEEDTPCQQTQNIGT